MHSEQNPFLQHYQGYFRNILQWDELAALWEKLGAETQTCWFVYAPGEALPAAPSSPEQLRGFLHELDQLLRQEHDYDYCGIVYVDNPTEPRLVKVYDPNHLGSSCGSGSQPPPLPGWILSRLPPCELQPTTIQTGSRRRWWQRIFGG